VSGTRRKQPASRGKGRALKRRFTSTHTNKVDGKGRVSVPAAFRAALEEKGTNVLYLTPNRNDGAIDGFGEAYMEEVEKRINALTIGSPERRTAERRFFARTRTITYDPDGRFVLPRDLMEFAGIADQATFVGLGQRFQVWSPKAYEDSIGLFEGDDDGDVELPAVPAASGEAAQ